MKANKEKSVKQAVQSIGVKTLFNYIEKDPEINIPKAVAIVEKMDINNTLGPMLETVKGVANNPESNWFQLIKSLYTDIDPSVRKKLLENYVINTGLIGLDQKRKVEKRYNCNVPWAILMDPTSACNLHCTGCWAAEYGNKLNMTFEELDNIIEQGKALGTYMYLYSGGEPTVRKEDIFKLCEKHNDCVFLAFTNGTMIDEDFADNMLRVGNFVPAISIEGDEEATDFRRGKGTYAKVIRAMDILKEKKLPFGISCCYTSKNTETIGSEAYFDEMIERGAKFAWFFTYMPIGNEAVPELMATAEQRKFMYDQIRKFRQTKPIFTMDFWNDGEYVGGCIAGGRCYLHINAGGDIEPCAFAHYSDSNVREKTLLQAYRSPMFMAYRKRQPFNENLLRPCPVLDNPHKITEMVKESGAHSTDLQSPEDVENLSEKCVDRAENWAPVADELWEKTIEKKAARQ